MRKFFNKLFTNQYSYEFELLCVGILLFAVGALMIGLLALAQYLHPT